MKPQFGDEVEFPLTINTQDTKGNILKMRLQLAVEPDPDSALPLPNSDKQGTDNNHEAIAAEGSGLVRRRLAWTHAQEGGLMIAGGGGAANLEQDPETSGGES